MAIESVERALARHGAPLYVFHEIVHNQHVVADFSRRGVRSASSPGRQHDWYVGWR